MKNIFTRTLETTVRKSSIILGVFLGCLLGFLMVNLSKQEYGSYYFVLNDLVSLQHLYVFIGICGIYLLCMIASSTSGLIASEVHEGTFKLLVTKPNSRSSILLGKILGNYLGLFILVVLSLLSYYSAIILSNGMDGSIIRELVSYLPSYILYGIIVIFTIGSLACLLSCLCNKKIVAMLPILVIAIVALGVLPMIRVINQFSSSGQIISILDINYQLASVFKGCVELVGKISPSESFALLTNLFLLKCEDTDLSLRDWPSTIIVENSSLSSAIVITIWIALACILYFLAFNILKKKDI